MSDAFSEAVLRDCLAAFPHVRLTVTGDCLTPQLRHGDAVVVVSTRQRLPRLGDVVLVRHAQGLRLHRLVWRPTSRGRWRTKGDHATLWDPAIHPADVLGTVVGGRSLARALRSLAGGLWARFRHSLPGTDRA